MNDFLLETEIRAREPRAVPAPAGKVALRELGTIVPGTATTVRGADGHLRGPNSGQPTGRSGQTRVKDPDAEGEDLTAQLAAAFRRGGLSAESAVLAARGRTRVLTPSELVAAHDLAAKKDAGSTEDLTPQLEAAFRYGGMSETKAKIAALGRGAQLVVRNLYEAAIVGGHSPAAATVFASGRGRRA